MSIKVRLEDADGSGQSAHVHQFSTARRSDHSGLLVLTRQFQDFDPQLRQFLNDDFGAAMNQNIAFSGTPEIIHNGGSTTEWTGTSIVGTWNFADSGKITITSADDNDAASFAEETPTTIDMSGFTTLTGKVDLDIYNLVNNSIIIQFDNAGTPVGNSVNLNDFIDTGDFSEQNFVIPKADLGLTTQLLDGMTISITRLGGTKPTIKFDDIQFEQTGDSAIFKATTTIGTRFHVHEIVIRIEDALSAVLTDGSMPNIDPSSILGVSSLSNGIVITRLLEGKTSFSVTLKNLGDFFSTGLNAVNITGNATNTGLTLIINFPDLVVLNGKPDNFLSFTINDNLSGLTKFIATARGAVEI